MKIEKRTNELVIHFLEKVVKLRGHQDNDAFSLFIEDFETCTSMSQTEKEALLNELQKRKDIIIR